MDEQNLANYLRMSGGSDQAQGWAPTADDMKDAMARLMAPDANLDALAGPPRKPLYPSLADTLGKMGEQYQQMPNGPMHPEHEGQTPVINPFASRPMPPMPAPSRGFR